MVLIIEEAWVNMWLWQLCPF